MPVPNNAERHALYRFFGETGQLLYAGISNDPGRRFGQHGTTKTWWPTVRGITLEWYSSRRDALAAEARVIEVERPLFNAQRPGVKAPALQRCGHCEGCVEDYPWCHLYSEALPDEDPPRPCPRCGGMKCLYVVGYDDGAVHGWQEGATWRDTLPRGDQ